METKLDQSNQVVTNEKADTSKQKLLELRKAQAKELAALKDVNFSIDEELSNIREMLVNDEAEVDVQVLDSIDQNDLFPQQNEENTLIETDNKKTDEELDNKEKEKLRLQREKEKEKEKLRLQKQKEKEKEKLRLQKQKEKEKEKLRLQKQKEKEKEKLRLKKQREKEREKLRLKKQKEKEREKLRLQKEKEKLRLQEQKNKSTSKTSTARKVTKTIEPKKVSLDDQVISENVTITKAINEGKATIVMSEDKKSDLQDIKMDSLEDNLVDSEEEAKRFFDNAKPTSMVSNILDRPKEKKESGIIDNLQRLREQIMAQKRLERELMEVEAKNVQKKELTLKSKLTELESLVREEEESDRNYELLEELENTKIVLTQELEEARATIERLLSLKYSNITVIDPNKLTLSNEFLDSISAVSPEALYNELEAVQNELTELREIHELNRQSLLANVAQTDESMLNSERYIETFNKLRADIDKYKDKSIELENQLIEANQIKDRMLFEEKDRFDKAIIKKQNELDIKYLNRESSLIKEYENKTEEIRSSLKNKLTENINKAKLGLEAKYKGKLKDQNALERELKKQTDKLVETNYIIDTLNYDLQISEKNLAAKIEQLEYLENKLMELDNKTDKNVVNELHRKISELENDINSKTFEINNLNAELLARNQEIDKLKIELTEVEKMTNDRVVSEYKEQITKLETEVGSMSNEIELLNNKIDELNKSNNNWNTVYLNQQEELTKLIDLKEKLTSDIQKQNQLIIEKTDELNVLHAQKSNELQDNSLEFQTQIDNLKEDNVNKVNEINQLLSKIENLETESKDNQDYLSQNKIKLQELQQEFETTSINYQQVQNELKEMSDNLLQANSSLALALKEKNELTMKLHNITNDYAQSEVELTRMANELEVIKENRHDPEVDNIRKVNEELYDLQEKLTVLKSGYEVQIAGFQEQINELTSLLSSQGIELNEKINEVVELKTIIQDIEDAKTESNNDAQDLSDDGTTKVDNINDEIQKLIEAYTKEQDLLTYKFNNDISKLEIEKKFVSNPADVERINSNINELTYKFNETIIRNNNKLQVDIQVLSGQEDDTSNESELTDNQLSEEQVEDEVQIELQLPIVDEEEQSFEEEIEEETDEAQIEQQFPIVDEEDYSLEEEIKAELDDIDFENEYLKILKDEEEPTPINSQVVINEKRRNTDFQQSQFVGIVDNEYLNRLNNIHRMRRNLEAKKEEYLNDFNNVSIDSNNTQEELKKKIAEIKAKINLLEQQYRQNKGYHPDRERQYENDKTKLYLELEGRQEKLRKTIEEESRIHGLKYKSLIKNMDEQLAILDKEEMQLKEYYLNKQDKLQSKINRENEILEKLQAEKATKVNDEGRVIESQQEIKERLFYNQPEEDNLEPFQEDSQDEVEAVEPESESEPIADLEVEMINETEPFEEELIPEPEETVIETAKPNEKLGNITAKEHDLRNLYNRFANAEAVLVRENRFVREYKNTRSEVLAYAAENKRLNEIIESLSNSLNDASSEKAQAINDQIKEYEVRKNIISKRVSYLDKQLINMESNSFVQEYRKVVEKLESMEDILQQYQEVKQGLQ